MMVHIAEMEASFVELENVANPVDEMLHIYILLSLVKTR